MIVLVLVAVLVRERPGIEDEDDHEYGDEDEYGDGGDGDGATGTACLAQGEGLCAMLENREKTLGNRVYTLASAYALPMDASAGTGRLAGSG